MSAIAELKMDKGAQQQTHNQADEAEIPQITEKLDNMNVGEKAEDS